METAEQIAEIQRKGQLTYDDLATRWQCSARNARRIVKRWGLLKKAVKLGHRTVRFYESDILRAEERKGGRQSEIPTVREFMIEAGRGKELAA
ncbi:MAG: hypothetical protein AB1705_27395 [Verrucomicrobiota bacterium]